MGEYVEDTGGECADSEGEEHVSELRDGRIGEHALDVVLHQADGRGEDGRRAPIIATVFMAVGARTKKAFERATM